MFAVESRMSMLDPKNPEPEPCEGGSNLSPTFTRVVHEKPMTRFDCANAQGAEPVLVERTQHIEIAALGIDLDDIDGRDFELIANTRKTSRCNELTPVGL
jgi:hypothetical protein